MHARTIITARTQRFLAVATITAALAACSKNDNSTGPVLTQRTPCGSGGTVQLSVAQSTRLDCSNGGTTVTLAGSGASYLVVPQFATDQGTNQLVGYRLSTTTSATANIAWAELSTDAGAGGGTLPPLRPTQAQRAADVRLRAWGAQQFRAGAFARTAQARSAAVEVAPLVPTPPVGSIRSFRVLSNFNTSAFKSVGAQLAYAGDNILMYVDTLAPANGFTADQLQRFGDYFDKTLFAIGVNAFGPPSDLDQNGHVVVLLSPVVNADTPKSTCSTQGFVAGFFVPNDFSTTDPNSNQGEVFYSIVPDPAAVFSCAHTVDNLGLDIPSTFLHELQHLIAFSQHVVLNRSSPMSSWLDEGLSIVAEELGSLYWEAKCPPPSCRTNPAQIFPDSAQGFVSGFLYDSYQYALRPDTASLTLHTDDQQGFSWRGGDWLLSRWLGDQFGIAFYQKLERGPANGIADIEQAAGQSFPSLFANFGLSLETDSLPGLSRATAPPANRFQTRNVTQLWARLFTTTGGTASDVPLAHPIQLTPITADAITRTMAPGTMAFFRLDTPASAATVSLQFSTAAGAAFGATLHPQVAIFRLPPGQ